LSSNKGLLAADESFPSIEKRFLPLGIPSTEETRRSYREMLFTTPALGESISGVILFDETIRQEIAGGRNVAAFLNEQGILPGIKVDTGAVPLPGFPGETITQGLDGLRERLEGYFALGARFTKWRAVIRIGADLPSGNSIRANAEALARFAALCQEAGLLPIVEPEVLMDGDHSLARCEEVMTTVLRSVFAALGEHRVRLEGMILKSGMVLSGKSCPERADDAEITEATLQCFRRTVPAAVPGIVFLSGGQADVEATRRLNAIAQLSSGPWKITFSYGRALQDAALQAWHGSAENQEIAQAALLRRAQCNRLATGGAYTGSSES
ncbi:MAG: fructose-bisphosphate aldolase, partial [Akkermansiaceae bacterium]|nr:fructose-bisphosphate aldolase [Akkermansiaceae bacterium]